MNSTRAQGYAKDSLQIKVYTEITYQNKEAKEIKLTTVFCDYCSDKQTTKIGYEALNRAYNERYNPDNILENGIKRLAIIIRISKDDFLEMNTEETEIENEDIPKKIE
ncbi:MAG: hypothetical protein CMC55_07355 [Flavobacteriaceae bacterium]|nr:hypothetical protein [Flavobacteriaceae bacterium]